VVHGPSFHFGASVAVLVRDYDDVLAFDLRVYDSERPIFATLRYRFALSDPKQSLDVILTPSDPGWLDAYMSSDNNEVERQPGT